MQKQQACYQTLVCADASHVAQDTNTQSHRQAEMQEHRVAPLLHPTHE